MDFASGISAYVSTISRQLFRTTMLALRELQITWVVGQTHGFVALLRFPFCLTIRIRTHRASLPSHPDSCLALALRSGRIPYHQTPNPNPDPMQDHRQKPSDIPLLRQKQVMADYSPIRWICRGICTRNGIANAPIPAYLQTCMISLLFLPIFYVHVCMICCTRGEQQKIVFPVTMQRVRKLST